ncbi:MAG: hypothetical protein K6E51_14365 [Treponema sp.]|nr:hypothetical protein [Treponema sp.]
MTNLVEVRVRTTEKMRNRLKLLKDEFKMKSMSKLVNIFFNNGVSELENKLVFTNEKSERELLKQTLEIANGIQKIERDLIGYCTNLNQIAKNSNIAKEKTYIIPAKRVSRAELQLKKYRIEDAIKAGEDPVLIQRLKDEYNEMLSGEISSRKTSSFVQLTDEEIKSTFMDVNEIKMLTVNLHKSSEELGKVLWKMIK